MPDGDRSVRLPPQKDDPDLLSALKVGWSRGAREFHIYGALGGRIDHTIANMQLMALLASHGGIGYLYGDGSIVTYFTPGHTPGHMSLMVNLPKSGKLFFSGDSCYTSENSKWDFYINIL